MDALAEAADDPLRDVLTAALGAQYDVVRLIGKGGMGAVYLGRERLLDRAVAIKVLPHESGDTEDARERFLREARTAAKLTHPNVVPLFSFGEAGKTLFYVMGYVEGESLEQRLRREGRLSFDETRRILGELAAALDHAHAHGIVHRDIKPDNVFLDAANGRVVLTDFGIAKQQVSGHALTQTGMIVGTPHYLSPEQASGERDLDGRSDIYSLGIMGYRMLAGRLPFAGGSLQELIAQHVSREPTPLGTIVPEVPPDLEAAIARCLAKDPAQRWQRASQLREALGSGDVAIALPDALNKFPGSGAFMVMLAYFATVAFSATWVFTGDAKWLLVALFGWVGGTVAMLGSLWRGKRHGMSLRRLMRIAFWTPKFWPLWWPRSLRRPGDVWDQLPTEVRRVRGVVSVATVSLAGLFAPVLAHRIAWIRSNRLPDDLLLSPLIVGATGTALAALAIIGASAYTIRWRKKYQLSALDADRLRLESTWNSRFWKRPEIARLLSSQARAPLREAMPDTPADIVAGLEKLLPAFAEPLGALVADGVAAAREMARAITAADDELRVLARDADPGERDRQQHRLTALGTPRPDEPASSRQMRDLVSGQLALMDQLARRSDELSSRRARYLELLQTLWLQVSSLRAQQASDALAASETSGRIRELCRSVEQARAGEREAMRVIAGLDAPTTTTPVH